MNFKKDINLIIFLIFILVTCKRVTEPLHTNEECNSTTATLQFLGYEDKFALRMALSEPYLYVCAGSDGVWKRDIRNMSEWQYLGLRDTSLGKYTNVGVVDIDVLNNDIMVAYNGAALHIDPESTVSIWRSKNGGIGWFRSDSGIPQTINNQYEYNIINTLQRSPHNNKIALAKMGPAVYRSTDAGSNWVLIAGRRNVAVGLDYIRWHPFEPGEVWFFGETSVFSPYCGAAQDYGLSWKAGVDWDSLGFPADGAVYDVAFDAGNPNIVYAATSIGVIETIDGGYTWNKNAFDIPDNGFVFQMVNHPTIGGRIYMAGGKRIYIKCDSDKKAHLIGEIENGFITSLVFDVSGNQLFVGTTEGGIYALKLNGR